MNVRLKWIKLGTLSTALLLGSTLAAAPHATAASGYTVHGMVACSSGAPVKAVQVVANNGGSGPAQLGRADDVTTLVPNKIRFAKNIPNGGTYWLRVDCASSMYMPAKSVFSNTTSSRNPDFRCNNFPRAWDLLVRTTQVPLRGKQVLPPYGRCA